MTDRSGVLRGRQAEAERNDQRVLDAARAVVARYGADAPVSAGHRSTRTAGRLDPEHTGDVGYQQAEP